MTLTTSEKANVNYLAKVVELKNIRKHSNADKLQITTIDGNNIITGLEAQDGDLYVYFPLECSINSDFLSFSNSFKESERNQNKEAVGFFEYHGRVRALVLRGEKSCGYICPVHVVNDWLKQTQNSFSITEKDIDVEFDTICNKIICEKYVNRVALKKLNSVNKSQKGQSKLLRKSKLVEGQFAFHVTTQHLQKFIRNIDPNDVIHISQKLHGTSGIAGKILCNKKLTLKEKIAKFFGVKVQETEYQLIWSSRKVIKNESHYYSIGESLFSKILDSIKYPSNILNSIKHPKKTWADVVGWYKFIKNPPSKNHYYSHDVWRDAALYFEDYLTEGMTIYCEIVGYSKTGQYLQKQYDYGCDVGEFKAYIYRITYTNVSGKVFEFSTQQIKQYCDLYGLKMVPELYWGRAKDLFDIDVDDKWHDNFIQKLSDTFLEKDCDLCVNKVPDEGIVLRKENINIEPYKYKSFAFWLRETKEADKGEVDLETLESENE
jgi:hypothetical protein